MSAPPPRPVSPPRLRAPRARTARRHPSELVPSLPRPPPLGARVAWAVARGIAWPALGQRQSESQDRQHCREPAGHANKIAVETPKSKTSNRALPTPNEVVALLGVARKRQAKERLALGRGYGSGEYVASDGPASRTIAASSFGCEL